MQSFKHPNVMSLIGVCKNLSGGPAVVMPFMANGSILHYLKKNRKNLVPIPVYSKNVPVIPAYT